VARAVDAADLAVEAAVGHADALLEVGASRDAMAVLEHAGVDVAHPPPGLHVELARRVQRRLDAQELSAGRAVSSSASAAP
jgi:hypothetical protein